MPSTCVLSEDITRGKPDPQPYLLAAERLGVDIAECIVLEDSPAGVRAGRGSGATTVVVGSRSDFDGRPLRLPDLGGTSP
ncbi:HAD family hydrolase [Luteococcus sp.]|uniref:HAD family hydrolase n=1 Tax=Luteococcus sp. TaxID=1969402 RepID=UPI0037356326